MKQPLPPQNPPNILVVIDDPHSMRLIEKSLSSLDVNIIKATTAQTALKQINRHDIMLAVLDMGLKNMHGIELVKQIRAHKKMSLTPVITLTTDWGNEALIKECYASGVVDMMNKPIMEDMLVAKARVVLELYAQNEQIRQQAGLIDAVGQAIIATDLNGIIWFWNRMAEEMFGWKAVEVIGKNTIDITTTHASKKEAQEIFKQLQKGEKWTGEFQLKRKDGSVFTGIVTDAPVTDQHGKLIGIIGATTNITPQKKELEQQPAVLVVDDLESNLQLIRGVLKPLKVNVITVRSGREALEMFKKTNIAVALIDVKMPEMNGLELVKKIRQDTRHELIPLIFITAHPRTTKNIEEYYDTGVVDLISKPFNHNVLRGKVAVFLEMYKQKQQIDRQNNALESLVKELNNSIQELQTAHIERDKAFADLQKSAETEHALINASLDSVMLIEPDGTIVAHNEIMAKKLNLTSGKLAGSCVYDLLPGETASFRKQKVAEVMDTGNPLRFEDCQSDLIFQQHSLYPIKDAEGNTYRLAIFVHDITQQKQGEIALRESEKMYRTLLSASPQGILILDIKRMITNISDITVEIFGAAGTNEIIGRDFFSLIPDKEYGSIKSILSKTLSEGLVQNEEVTLEKRNGAPFVSEISATLIQGEDGKPKAYMLIIRDISQRKMMEQQLIRSERMISLGEMASGMAHEINQPLLSIQFGIENLLNKIRQSDAVDTKYLARKAESIFGDISRINHIIDHVRAFSKDQEYILASFDVNESIKNAISMISQQFKQHEIKLQLDLKKDPGLVYGNTYKLEQVILNLLSNARDAVKQKASVRHTDYEKKVTVRSLQDDLRIIIEVEDNGVGIDNVDTDKLFLPFFTNKDKGKGTGLGLPISFEIINDFNGTIDFDSIPGTGTIFRIQLPKA
jgi:PAS domain S-box-containing protein